MKNTATSATPKKRRRSSGVGKSRWRDTFLESLGRIPNISVACARVTINRSTAYRERDRSKVFARQWEEACQRGVESLEAQCWQRAHSGVARGVWKTDAQGNPVKVEEVREFSDVLAIFMLKAHNPQKYRETVKTEITGADGGAVAVKWFLDPEAVTGPAPVPPKEAGH